MAKFGWCIDGHHDDGVERLHSKPCPGIIDNGTGTRICECWCHGGGDGEATAVRTPDDDDAGRVPVPA